jgi:hypothetical protein
MRKESIIFINKFIKIASTWIRLEIVAPRRPAVKPETVASPDSSALALNALHRRSMTAAPRKHAVRKVTAANPARNALALNAQPRRRMIAVLRRNAAPQETAARLKRNAPARTALLPERKAASPNQVSLTLPRSDP